MNKLDSFPFHKLLQDKYIKELEALIEAGYTEFTVKRLGTYSITRAYFINDKPNTIIYSGKTGKYYITAKEK
jgi:hypothetical protein